MYIVYIILVYYFLFGKKKKCLQSFLYIVRLNLITVILWDCKFKNKMYENNVEYKTKIACKYFMF